MANYVLSTNTSATFSHFIVHRSILMYFSAQHVSNSNNVDLSVTPWIESGQFNLVTLSFSADLYAISM